MQSIEKRLAEYIPIAKPGEATHLFVSQLTREHLRKTLSFFVSVSADQKPVPFDRVGTGTLNTLVLALLSFIAELKDENVIFAMEEPEIALPPHTQRRIADYLLKSTTQCFVTSHSPYVIECFDPERITILRRNEAGEVSGKQVALGVAVKAKTYRRFLRRGLAEAMLSKGVIVSEGMTEQLALRAVADKLEQVDETTYPLDLAGVTLFCADGDGSIAEFGRFLCSLDVPVSAFLDKKTRSASERTALEGAGFTHLVETAYAGMEELLVAEVPVNCQWRYLDAVRQSGTRGTVNIPDTQPANDNDTKGLAKQVLVDGKGWGRAADLIDCCSVDELPASLVSFLRTIYEQFPRPKVEEPPATCDAENVGDATTGESAQE
jgi:putative ATP-dependent endonuclease of OLD family